MRHSILLGLLIIFLSPLAAAQELDAQNLVTPSAKDILDQIEGRPSSSSPIYKIPEGAELFTFEGSETVLDEEQKAALLDNELLLDKSRRIKILSYASPLDGDAMSARRISLERALLIRELLKDHGVEPVRIDIFPMGDQVETAARDYAVVNIPAN